MPPKKDSKKQAQAKPDHSGIPKQDVQFKFSFNFKSDAAQLPPYVIMFQWFGALSDKLQRFESGLLETWKKDQNSYTFQKDCDLIRVDDDFCKTLTTKKFYVYFVNSEDNKVQDSILIDFSSLLMFKSQNLPQMSYQTNTIKILNIDSFSIKLTADKQLIQEVYRHYLNPFEVEVVGAKDLPLQNSSKYEPTYVKYQFFDGSTVETHAIVGNDKILWSHKHVFLAGLMNPIVLKQKIRSNYLKFELHDRDQIQNKKIKEDIPLFDVKRAIQEELQKQKPVEEDPKKKGAKKEEKKEVKKEAKKQAKKKDVKMGEPILPEKIETLKNNYGVSAYHLIDFLKPSMKTAKYKAPVVPKNTFQDFQSKNIDLNTTARNQMQKIISSNNYFERDTILVVGFTISYAIGTFVKPQVKEEVIEDPKKKKDPKEAVVQKKVEHAEAPVQRDVFERLVYLIPFKDIENIKTIQDTFYDINLKAFNLTSKRQITTYLLKKDEKESLTLNYVSGIEIIDPDGRIYILEGLKKGGIQEFNKKILKNIPNTKQFKIFKNSNMSFSHRLFTDFNIQLKRIRMRPSLSAILLDPCIYIKSKVAEQICQNLNKLNDIRKICDDLATVDGMNLWPSSDWLIQIQRKYSQSLSHQDITGEDQTKTKKSIKKAQDSQQLQKTIQFVQSTELKYVTTDQFFLPKLPQAQHTANDKMYDTDPNLSKKRNVQTKTFVKDSTKIVPAYQMRGKKADIPANEPVYIYAGQKLNFYEKQMREMRDKVQNDPKTIYTYSKDYLGLSIDPRNLQEEHKKDLQMSKTKNYSNVQFSSLLVKTKDERMRLPKKPTDEDIKNMKEFPFHQQKSREKQILNYDRGLPIENGKPDFQKYIKKEAIFSQPEVLEGEKMSPVQREIMEKEKKKKQAEQAKKKRLGDSAIKIKKGYCSDKVTGVDRFKDIRQGSPNKIGIIDIHKKTHVKRPIEELEVSLFQKQERINPGINILVRKDDPSKNIQKDEFNFYQQPEILTKSQIYKPLKNT